MSDGELATLYYSHGLDGRRVATDAIQEEGRALVEGLAVGETVFIRTFGYHYVGKITALAWNTITLQPAAWVADSGRWHEALTTGRLLEVEPFPDKVLVNSGNIEDVTPWPWPVPRKVIG